jgi:motility quorum-sensing regulator/GCU-specific mRNA interferase toxin
MDPHCPLNLVKQRLEEGKIRATWTALQGAASLGTDFDGMVEVVRALTATTSTRA